MERNHKHQRDTMKIRSAFGSTIFWDCGRWVGERVMADG